MIGLFALVALEFVSLFSHCLLHFPVQWLHSILTFQAVDKGILEILGFDVGKGLNLPL